MIIANPRSTFEAEKAMLPSGTFSFDYKQRQFSADDERSRAYDQRFIERHQFPEKWIIGWWNSYYGWICSPYPVPLLKSRPFHHPWIIVDEIGEEAGAAQRQPIKGTEGCSYAVLCGEVDGGWYDEEYLKSYLTRYPMKPGFDGSPLDYGDPETDDPLTRELWTIPMGTWAGITRRSVPASILRWVRAAANWIAENPDELDVYDDPLLEGLVGLYAFQQEAVLYGKIPIPVR